MKTNIMQIMKQVLPNYWDRLVENGLIHILTYFMQTFKKLKLCDSILGSCKVKHSLDIMSCCSSDRLTVFVWPLTHTVFLSVQSAWYFFPSPIYLLFSSCVSHVSIPFLSSWSVSLLLRQVFIRLSHLEANHWWWPWMPVYLSIHSESRWVL